MYREMWTGEGVVHTGRERVVGHLDDFLQVRLHLRKICPPLRQKVFRYTRVELRLQPQAGLVYLGLVSLWHTIFLHHLPSACLRAKSCTKLLVERSSRVRHCAQGPAHKLTRRFSRETKRMVSRMDMDTGSSAVSGCGNCSCMPCLRVASGMQHPPSTSKE
jgi:hypothetical protein